MADGPYRIWLRRSDTHNRITDEDIWVGNVPNDGKSKISSGYTQHSEEWAYVEFATWDDLLKAIGEDEQIVNVTVTGQFEQIDGGGGGGETTINVTVSGNIEQLE